MDPAVFLYRRKKERTEILSPLFGFLPRLLQEGDAVADLCHVVTGEQTVVLILGSGQEADGNCHVLCAGNVLQINDNGVVDSFEVTDVYLHESSCFTERHRLGQIVGVRDDTGVLRPLAN